MFTFVIQQTLTDKLAELPEISDLSKIAGVEGYITLTILTNPTIIDVKDIVIDKDSKYYIVNANQV